jgi:hypothetical protein
MAEIGHGYGSEWHLLRYLGRHLARLASEVQRVTSCDSVQWLDFPFGRPPWARRRTARRRAGTARACVPCPASTLGPSEPETATAPCFAGLAPPCVMVLGHLKCC